MMEKVFKVKHGTRNGEKDKHDKRLRALQAVHGLSQLWRCVEMCRAGQSLAPSTGCASSPGAAASREEQRQVVLGTSCHPGGETG